MMKQSFLFSAALAASVLTACGTGSYSNPSGLPDSPVNSETIVHGDTDVPSWGNPTQRIEASPTFERDAPIGTNPPVEFLVRGVGYEDAQTFSVQANRVLKVKVAPGVQDRTIEGTGLSPQYSQLSVRIKIGNSERVTPLLANGKGGLEAEESDIYNLSNSFDRTCDVDDLDCRQEVSITIERPNYDYWCFNYGMYCSHTWVYFSHPWNLKLFVETDDTVALEGFENS